VPGRRPTTKKLNSSPPWRNGQTSPSDDKAPPINSRSTMPAIWAKTTSDLGARTAADDHKAELVTPVAERPDVAQRRQGTAHQLALDNAGDLGEDNVRLRPSQPVIEPAHVADVHLHVQGRGSRPGNMIDGLEDGGLTIGGAFKAGQAVRPGLEQPTIQVDR